jgi:hypothetical protein
LSISTFGTWLCQQSTSTNFTCFFLTYVIGKITLVLKNFYNFKTISVIYTWNLRCKLDLCRDMYHVSLICVMFHWYASCFTDMYHVSLKCVMFHWNVSCFIELCHLSLKCHVSLKCVMFKGHFQFKFVDCSFSYLNDHVCA